MTEAVNERMALEGVATSLPELIRLDLMMPEVDGFAFLEALRQPDAWRLIPTVVVDGEGADGRRLPAPQWLRGTDSPEGGLQPPGVAP